MSLFYWEPFSRAEEDDGSWGSCMGIVDEKGVPTEGCKAFLANPKHADINKIAKIYEPRVITIPNENEVERYLPKQIKVLMWDGRLESKDVTWKDYDTNVGNDNFLGGELSSGEKVQVQIIIDTQASNLIRNGAFEEELCYWEVEASQGVKQEMPKLRRIFFQQIVNG